MVEQPISVLLADTHVMMREALARLLASEGDIEIAGHTTVGAAALALARTTSPTVVVTQVEPPVEKAKEYISALLGFSFRPGVVVMTRYEDPHLVRELVGAGARAYLVKNASIEELLSAIRSAATHPEGEDAPVVVAGMSRRAFERVGEGRMLLSGREMQILLLAARGRSNRQIARELALSEATIKRNLTNVYRRMGVASRGEAVREALSMGIFNAHDIAGQVE